MGQNIFKAYDEEWLTATGCAMTGTEWTATTGAITPGAGAAEAIAKKVTATI